MAGQEDVRLGPPTMGDHEDEERRRRAYGATPEEPGATVKRHKRRASDGSEAVVIEGSVRGRNAPTTADELDDYDDWLAEEEE